MNLVIAVISFGKYLQKLKLTPAERGNGIRQSGESGYNCGGLLCF